MCARECAHACMLVPAWHHFQCAAQPSPHVSPGPAMCWSWQKFHDPVVKHGHSYTLNYRNFPLNYSPQLLNTQSLILLGHFAPFDSIRALAVTEICSISMVGTLWNMMHLHRPPLPSIQRLLRGSLEAAVGRRVYTQKQAKTANQGFIGLFILSWLEKVIAVLIMHFPCL